MIKTNEKGCIMSETKQRKINPLTIVGIVLIVIFFPIIIINLTIVIKGAINPDKVPMVFNIAPLVVVSDSMTIDEKAGTGAFNKGDLIIIKKVDPKDLKKGDIVTYMTSDGEVITHRIIELVETKDGRPAFETKGDASLGVDYYAVTYNQIVGIYHSRIPNLGNVAEFMQKPAGILCVLGIPLVIFLAADVIFKSKNKENLNNKTAELEAEIARLKAEKAQQESEIHQEQPAEESTKKDSKDSIDENTSDSN